MKRMASSGMVFQGVLRGVHLKVSLPHPILDMDLPGSFDNLCIEAFETAEQLPDGSIRKMLLLFQTDEISPDLLIADPIWGEVVMLCRLTDGTHRDLLRAAGHLLRVQGLNELCSECCHRTVLLVEKIHLDDNLNTGYDGTHCEKYKREIRRAALRGAERLKCRDSGYVQQWFGEECKGAFAKRAKPFQELSSFAH